MRFLIITTIIIIALAYGLKGKTAEDLASLNETSASFIAK